MKAAKLKDSSWYHRQNKRLSFAQAQHLTVPYIRQELQRRIARMK